MSPLLRYNEDDPSQSRVVKIFKYSILCYSKGADEERDLREYLVTHSMNPLETAWAPIRKTKLRPIHVVYTNLSYI